MHGGSRNKRTRLLSSKGLYEDLAIDCDGNHPHAPWFVIKRGTGLSFATALEAESPKELCTRMAQCLLRQAEAKHIQVGSSLSSAQTSRQAWGVQTSKSKPLVPEFKSFHHPETELSTPGLRLLATPLPGVLQTELQQDPKRVRRTYKYGVQWEPQEFLQEAKAIVHPKDPQKALPDSLKEAEAVLQVMGHSPIDVAKHRLSVLLAVQRKSLELKEDEQKRKDSMDPRTAAVMANKRRKSLMNAKHSRREEQVQRDLHETTMKEVELGHLHGRFSEDEVTAHFGTDKWLFNPRFALYQGSENKVRAIDDGKRSALNLCYTTNFKLELYDVDTLAALIAAVADSLKAGAVNFDLAEDTSCSVPSFGGIGHMVWQDFRFVQSLQTAGSRQGF
eukprot:s207_g12.t1